MRQTKTINLLPMSYIQNSIIRKIIIRNTAIVAVIFFILILLVGLSYSTYSRISVQIQNLKIQLSDKRFLESEAIVSEIKIRTGTADSKDSLSEGIEAEKITIDKITAIADAVEKMRKRGENVKNFYVQELIFENDGSIFFTGIARERLQILEFITLLNTECNFRKVEVSEIVKLGENNSIRFRLAIER